MSNSKISFNLRPKCPQCSKQQPLFRVPKDWRQFLFGGWTCKQCGCRMDRHGKKIDVKK